MLLTEYKSYQAKPLAPTDSVGPVLTLRRLGLQDYEPIWRAMQYIVGHPEKRRGEEIWLLSHKPVFTMGQAGKPEHVLQAGKIPLVQTDRGGQVTYHGPGQLVIYLLLDVRQRRMSVKSLVNLIEIAIVDTLAEFRIPASTISGAPGVYVNNAKIAALGLRIRHGWSYHGLSLNVDMDLSPFRFINPCGYEGLEVTQVAELVSDRKNLMQRVAVVLSNKLLQQLNYGEAVEVSTARTGK